MARPRDLKVVLELDFTPVVEAFERVAEVAQQLDRMTRPWHYADPNPMPEIVLFPRLAKVERWLTTGRVRP